MFGNDFTNSLCYLLDFYWKNLPSKRGLLQRRAKMRRDRHYAIPRALEKSSNQQAAQRLNLLRHGVVTKARAALDNLCIAPSEVRHRSLPHRNHFNGPLLILPLGEAWWGSLSRKKLLH